MALLFVELAVAKRTFRPLEPIEVTITITNRSRQILYLSTFKNFYQDVDFEVHDLNSNKPLPVPRTRHHALAVEGALMRIFQDIHLKPGGHVKERLTVNLVSDMTMPSPYSVVVAVPYWIAQARDPKLRRVARSPALEVEVAGKTLTEKEVHFGKE
ncbi:MAG: hypothetical protein WKF75_01530 [Singulisphaera sp.]